MAVGHASKQDSEIVAITSFWRDAGPKRWFEKDPAFDAELRSRFLEAHLRAARRELDDWARSPDGALALMLLLDQVPRNVFRDTAHMYATDPLARLFADRALQAGADRHLDTALRGFLYLPFMHSEDPSDQERSVGLNRPLGGDSEKYALDHRDIIRRFGRFPHRNALLGRRTTAEEQRFLDAGGFAG